MAESIYGVVAIVVGTATVPPFETGVGTGLYLPEGDDGTRIGVPVEVGTYERVDISAVAVLAACGNNKEHKAAQQ